MTVRSDKRTFLKGAATLGAGLIAGPAIGRTKRPPNVLFICSDQEQSFADLPDILPRPHTNWLREHGAAFRNFHVHTTPCGPSRSNIYTGQHTQRTGVFMNPNTPPQPELPVDFPTMGDAFRRIGYHTAYKGKWHLSNINRGRQFGGVAGGLYPKATDALEPFGFSEFNFWGEAVGLTWDGFKLDGTIAGDAARAIRKYGDGAHGDKPWFLAVNLVNPHDIMFYDATGRQNETRVLANAIAPLEGAPGTDIYEKVWDVPLPRSFYEDDLSTKPAMHAAMKAQSSGFYGAMPLEDKESWRRFRNYYFNCVVDLDRHVGVVLDALRDSGQIDNTIIAYTSDHGERNGAHGLRQKTGTMYKEEVRVPLIVRAPGRPAFETEALGGSVDLVPTLLSLAGLPRDRMREQHPDLVGVDLSPALDGASARTIRDERGILFNYVSKYYWGADPDADLADIAMRLTHDPEGPLLPEPNYDLTARRLHRGVHSGRYKFARYFAPADHHTPESWDDLSGRNDLELYDILADPDEIVNLAYAAPGEPADADAKRTLLDLNAKTNALVRQEVGEDRGAVYNQGLERYNRT